MEWRVVTGREVVSHRMNLEPISLAIGLVIGLAVGLLIHSQRSKKAAQEGMRDLKTRLTSLHLRLERSQNELTATKGVVARLLEERQKVRANGQDDSGDDSGDDSQLMLVLTDDDTHQLARVRGIGPKLAVTLASYGITDLARLAEVSDRDLAVIEASAPSLADRMVRERWKQQAIDLLYDPGETPGEYSRIDVAQTDGYNFGKFRGPDQEEALNGSSN